MGRVWWVRLGRRGMERIVVWSRLGVVSRGVSGLSTVGWEW